MWNLYFVVLFCFGFFCRFSDDEWEDVEPEEDVLDKVGESTEVKRHGLQPQDDLDQLPSQPSPDTGDSLLEDLCHERSQDLQEAAASSPGSDVTGNQSEPSKAAQTLNGEDKGATDVLTCQPDVLPDEPVFLSEPTVDPSTVALPDDDDEDDDACFEPCTDDRHSENTVNTDAENLPDQLETAVENCESLTDKPVEQPDLASGGDALVREGESDIGMPLPEDPSKENADKQDDTYSATDSDDSFFSAASERPTPERVKMEGPTVPAASPARKQLYNGGVEEQLSAFQQLSIDRVTQLTEQSTSAASLPPLSQSEPSVSTPVKPRPVPSQPNSLQSVSGADIPGNSSLRATAESFSPLQTTVMESPTLTGLGAPSTTHPGLATPPATFAGLGTPPATFAGLRTTPATHPGLGAPSATPPGLWAPPATFAQLRTPPATHPGLGAPPTTLPGLRTPPATFAGLGAPPATHPGLGAQSATPPGIWAPPETFPGPGAPPASFAGQVAPSAQQAVVLGAPTAPQTRLVAPSAGLVAPSVPMAGQVAPSAQQAVVLGAPTAQLPQLSAPSTGLAAPPATFPVLGAPSGPVVGRVAPSAQHAVVLGAPSAPLPQLGVPSPTLKALGTPSQTLQPTAEPFSPSGKTPWQPSAESPLRPTAVSFHPSPPVPGLRPITRSLSPRTSFSDNMLQPTPASPVPSLGTATGRDMGGIPSLQQTAATVPPPRRETLPSSGDQVFVTCVSSPSDFWVR